jgi:hypothetical protein
VLLTSGNEKESASVETRPMRAFLPKPYALAEIQRRVQEMIARN